MEFNAERTLAPWIDNVQEEESSVFMKRNIRRKRLVPFLSQKHHLAPITIILRKLYPGDLGGVQFEDRPIIT